jgi:hypothetical protein
MVADLRGGEYVVLHRFAGNRGARSWRVSHPQGGGCADSKRIYYNVNAGEHTQTYVAEITT